MGWWFFFSYISEEDEYMIPVECYNFFSVWSFPGEVSIDMPAFTDIFSWDRE